jgi:hypothetical protein
MAKSAPLPDMLDIYFRTSGLFDTISIEAFAAEITCQGIAGMALTIFFTSDNPDNFDTTGQGKGAIASPVLRREKLV